MDDPFFMSAAPTGGRHMKLAPGAKRPGTTRESNNFTKRRDRGGARDDAQATKRRRQEEERDENGTVGFDNDDAGAHDQAESESEEDTETAQEKRIRLAHEYVKSLESQIDDDDDAEKSETLANRLRNEVLEKSGRLHRKVAHAFRDFEGTDMQVSSRAHKLAVTAVVVSPDNKYIYSGSKDCSIIMWDLKTCERLHTFHGGIKKKAEVHGGHTDHILALAISSDGTYLASGGNDKQIFVWDLRTRELVKKFKGHKGAIRGLAFRIGSHQLFSACEDKTLKVWSLDEMAYVETLFGHQDHVAGVDCLHKERCISVGTRDRSARVWKIIEETQLLFEGKVVDDSLDCVSLVNEQHFVTGSTSGHLAVWGVMKKRPLAKIRNVHGKEWVSCVTSMKFTDLVASGSCDGFVRLWRLDNEYRSLTPIAEIAVKGFVNSLCFSPDGMSLIVGVGDEHRLGRWNKLKGTKNGVRVITLPDSSKVAANEDSEGDSD